MSSHSTPSTPACNLPSAFDTKVVRWIVEDDPCPVATKEEEARELNQVEDVMIQVMMNTPSMQETIMRNLDEVITNHETTEQVLPLLETTPGQDLLREVLINKFQNRMTALPPSTTDLHPGYPYREQTAHDDDLLNRRYICPYVAAKVDPITGELRILGRADKEAPMYDEGPLHATEVPDVNDDMEEEVGEYPFGEDAYLDPNFLEAMGTIGDRGLASEGLRLVQLDGEKRFLKRWETQLKRHERAIHIERTDYIRCQEKIAKKQTDVYH